MNKKIIAFMLSLAILCPVGTMSIMDINSTIPISATSESSTPTDESSFTFDSSTGTITKYTGTDTNVVIPDTINGIKVTAIGEEAFSECTTLKDITISDNVTYIGVSAFYNCTALENIKLSQNLTSIDTGAFSKCSALTSINIPDSVTSIGIYAISNCTKLENVKLSKNLTSISNYTFSGCSSLESITIPDSVTSIGNGVFWYCEKLKNVTLSKNLTSIGEDAFCGAVFTEIELPSSVTTIKEEAFYHCEKLASITIPKNATSIDDNAFVGCSSLKTVYICNKNIDTSNLKIFGDYTEPQSILTFDEDTGTITKYTGSATEITIPNTISGVKVTTIGQNAFRECTSLTNIKFPDGLTSFSESSFYGCTALTDITLPDSLTKTGNNAFGECTNLKTVTFGKNSKLKSVDYGAFMKCTSLTSINLPKTVKTISMYAFKDCTSLTNINIPTNTSSILKQAFYNTGLTKVEIPSSVTSIGEDAFTNCKNLTNMIIYKSKDECTNFNLPKESDTLKITYAESLFIFDKTTGTITGYTGTATEIEIPNKIGGVEVTAIGDNAFSNTALTEVTIPKNATSIGNDIFVGCNNLKTIYLCNGNRDISNLNISEDGTLPESIFIFDEDENEGIMYRYIGTLEDIVIPEQIDGVKVTSINEQFIDDGFFINYAYNPQELVKSITLPDTITSIKGHAFQGCSLLKSINIPEGVTAINDYTFSGCASLESITLPKNLQTIGQGAFDDCTSITNIEIPKTVNDIGSFAFCNCTELKSIEIPEGIEHIFESTFSSCENLESITLPTSLKSIEDDAFNWCSSLKNVNIPKNITKFGANAFGHCTLLESIEIPSGVTSIGSYAFYMDSSLTSITIPNSVTEVGEDAFEYCDNLQTIIVDKLKSDCTKFDLPKENDTLKIYYNVKVNRDCSNLTSSNLADEISSYDGYTTTLTANDGYTLPKDITIKVGDTTLKDGYTFENGVLTIPKESLTDNITIEANGIPNEYTVTNKLTNIKSNGTEVALHGEEYKATLTANDGYTLPSDITIKVGNTILKDGYTFKDGVLTISADKVTGNITIEATGKLKEYSVTSDLTNIKSNGSDKISHGKEYKATLTANDGYTLPSDITIKVGNTVLKDGYTFKDGVLTISGEKVTGNITITATATATAITDNKSLDLLRLKKHILGVSEIEDITPLDANNDGVLNIIDVINLKNAIINE